MIRQILKSARLIIEIALVIAIFLFIYWWNPMGLFGGKLKLQPTANLSSQVRELGELVTAEYYGEVISSIEEAQVDDLLEPNLSEHANEVISELREMLKQLKSFDELNIEQINSLLESEDQALTRREKRRLLTDDVSRSNLLDRLQFHGDWEALELLPKHHEVLNYLFDKTDLRKRPVQTNLNNNQLKDLLILLYEKPTEIDRLWDVDDFVSAYYQRRREEMPKNDQRKRLAMIGRGTVKAGFDLQELTPNMFFINEVSKELHFFGLNTKILDADINPWFIPEKGVPGFDILTYNGRVNFKDAKKVKEYAIQKLETNALNARILESAEKFGGESLMQLFSLMTGKEINQVFFHNDRFIQLSQQIMKDRFINYEEAMLFESTLRTELKIIDSLQNSSENRFNNQQLGNKKWEIANRLTKEIQTYPFENDGCRYGYFSTWAYGLSHRGLIDSVAQDSIRQLRAALKARPVLPDSLFMLWAERDSLFLMDQFNQAMQFMMVANTPVGTTKTIEYPSDNIDSAAVNTLRATVISQTAERSVFEYIQASDVDSVFLLQNLFPFRYLPTEWESMADKRIRTLSDTQDDSSLSGVGTSSFLFTTQTSNGPWKLIPIPFDRLVNPFLFKQLPRGLLCLEGDLCVVNSVGALPNNPPISKEVAGISSNQSQELALFLNHLINTQEERAGKGPITRANRWFSEKLENAGAIRQRLPNTPSP
ncbi:DUF4230 domain-containing protein [Lunatimonas salinarum]|uniref:DUF4230 domain-containing protein n=1 Tax=Lunatimonas salinarum TaxID=1774590 RepID=UPI001ADFDCB3|nr:DUF4230 domain-containing protein [Lunatimonas salinarum]